MNIVLISTSNVGAGRSKALDRMLTSVAQAALLRPDVPIMLLLLLQESSSDPRSFQKLPAFVDVLAIPDRFSLSAARNILLSRACARGVIGLETIIGFPDDDCWYPQGTLELIADQFTRSRHLDLWFCRYASNPVAASEACAFAKPARVRDVVRQASSNTIFVRGKIIQLGVAFDEELGLGTPAAGAEDIEFALRAHFLSRQTAYFDAPIVGHRDKNVALRAKYYRGGLVAIARHARHRRSVVGELARKVGVGAWLTLRGEMPLASYRSALGAGASAWINGP
jgi:hypothetical protein